MAGIASTAPKIACARPMPPALARLHALVVAAWPGHAAYLDKSLAGRSAAVLATSEAVADILLRLVGDRGAEMATDYHWLCDRIAEEELHFARTGAYRYGSFAETNAHVYSDADFMRRYMHGLMLSHVLWSMHAGSLEFFLGRIAARCPVGGRVLEVGSGHGLLLYLALERLGFASAEAWDLSSESLAQTRHALAVLGASDRATFTLQDMHHPPADIGKFDLVILSHILEHLEDPAAALRGIRPALGKAGLLFVNVPLNAPMPDHIVLLRDPAEALALVENAGFRVLDYGAHTTQNMPLPQALRRQVAVTCSIIAQPV